tara:strand:- start:399 stop:572 length:174 start_codon:yes stop_codon:yes gene_type:complete
MELTDGEIKILYYGLEFMLESITDDFKDEEMVEIYKEDQELLDKIRKELFPIIDNIN